MLNVLASCNNTSSSKDCLMLSLALSSIYICYWEKGRGESPWLTPIPPMWYKCWKLGHLERDCRQSRPKLARGKDKGEAARKPKRDLKDIECFNCHQKGHYASNCPSNALFCREKLPGLVGEKTGTSTELTRKGSVKERAVDTILLDISLYTRISIIARSTEVTK